MPKEFVAEIEWRNPNDLTPYINNNKRHPDSQIDKVAGSIAEFGVDQPLVIDSDGVIIKGHARREAALRLGLDKVPVVVRADLSEAQKKASRIADNKTAVSDFDEQAISLELEALKELEYDLSKTGFDTEEIDELLKLNGDEGYGGGTGDEDEVPEVDEVQPREGLVLGSIWQLGRHKIGCLDSTDEEQVRRVLGDRKVGMVFSDAPYGISIVAANGYVGGGEAYDIPFGGVKNRKGYVGGVTATEPPSQSPRSGKLKKNKGLAPLAEPSPSVLKMLEALSEPLTLSK